jgi:hypothetical protein
MEAKPSTLIELPVRANERMLMLDPRCTQLMTEALSTEPMRARPLHDTLLPKRQMLRTLIAEPMDT